MAVMTSETQAAARPGCSVRKADHLARLARIEGQVCRVTRMVVEDQYCTEVLTHISARQPTAQTKEVPDGY